MQIYCCVKTRPRVGGEKLYKEASIEDRIGTPDSTSFFIRIKQDEAHACSPPRIDGRRQFRIW